MVSEHSIKLNLNSFTRTVRKNNTINQINKIK